MDSRQSQDQEKHHIKFHVESVRPELRFPDKEGTVIYTHNPYLESRDRRVPGGCG